MLVKFVPTASQGTSFAVADNARPFSNGLITPLSNLGLLLPEMVQSGHPEDLLLFCEGFQNSPLAMDRYSGHRWRMFRWNVAGEESSTGNTLLDLVPEVWTTRLPPMMIISLRHLLAAHTR